MTLGGTRRSCPFWSFCLRLRPLRFPQKNVDPKVASQVFKPWFLVLKNNIVDSSKVWIVYLKASHLWSKKIMKCQFVKYPIGTSFTDHFHCHHLPVVSRLQKLRAHQRLIFVTGWRWMACDEECLPRIPGIPAVMILLMVQNLAPPGMTDCQTSTGAGFCPLTVCLF